MSFACYAWMTLRDRRCPSSSEARRSTASQALVRRCQDLSKLTILDAPWIGQRLHPAMGRAFSRRMVTRTRPMGFRERVVTLIRRTLTVPLFGLPPTPHELATWLVTYGTGDVHAMHRLQKTVTIGAESTCD